MSRTVDLWTPTVQTRNSPGGFGFNPNTIRRAVNTGRQLANAYNRVHENVSSLLRSPRITAGSVRRSTNSMARSVRRTYNRRARSRRTRTSRMRRNAGRGRRSRGRTSFGRQINRAKRGTTRLMRMAKSDRNSKYHYDHVHFTDNIVGSYTAKTTKIFTPSASDFPALNYYSALVPSIANVTPNYREFRVKKLWIKIHPKRAQNFRNTTNFPEVIDSQFNNLYVWPLCHNRLSDSTAPNISDYRLQSDPSPKKAISFFKTSNSIMNHGAFYEEAVSMASPENPTIYKPTRNMPWMEFSELAKIKFGSFAAQLPQFYTPTVGDPPETRETPKFTFSAHIIFELRSSSNSIAEITNTP